MGIRANVVVAGTTGDYTDNAWFNNRASDIADLFEEYNIQYKYIYPKRKELKRSEIAQAWAIKDTELKAIIAILEESPDETHEYLKEAGYTNQQAADVFKSWMEQADKNSGLVRIHWF